MKLSALALFLVVFTCSVFAQGVLIGTIDVNGDGVADNIYNSGSSITIVHGNNGGTRSYFISSGSWALVFGNSSSIVDLDGVAGAEIPVNVGGALMVITDRTQSVHNYNFSGNWAVAPGGITDMDGVAGAEMAVVNGSYLTIITQRTFNVVNYNIGTSWSIVPTGITDMDGVAGAEIAMASGSNLVILTPKTSSMHSYTIGTNWAVATSGVNGVSDMDGKPGAELAIVSGSNLVIVTPRTQSIASYTIATNWSILSNGLQNFNGKAGNDIALVVGGTGQLRVVHPADGSINSYSTGSTGTSWSLTGYTPYSNYIRIKIYSYTLGKNLIIDDALFEVLPG